MRHRLFILLFILISSYSYGANDDVEKKFNWAIKTLDRWLIEHQAVCDGCGGGTPNAIYIDSTRFEFDYESKILRMTDILDALTIVSTLTEIEPSIKYGLGTFGIYCIDCDPYESDRKKWVEWFSKNKSTINQEKIEKLNKILKE